MPRISNRRYPTAKCQNPACKKSFEPHDRRQKYCTSQCRINSNNDKRHSDNNTRFWDEKQTRVNNKILEKIWNKQATIKTKTVTKEILDWENFNFDSQALIKKNSKTNRPILWYYNNGLEQIGNNIYEIHHKT